MGRRLGEVPIMISQTVFSPQQTDLNRALAVVDPKMRRRLNRSEEALMVLSLEPIRARKVRTVLDRVGMYAVNDRYPEEFNLRLGEPVGEAEMTRREFLVEALKKVHNGGIPVFKQWGERGEMEQKGDFCEGGYFHFDYDMDHVDKTRSVDMQCAGIIYNIEHPDLNPSEEFSPLHADSRLVTCCVNSLVNAYKWYRYLENNSMEVVNQELFDEALRWSFDLQSKLITPVEIERTHPGIK